jgi:DNA repair ATPase RecN
MSEAYAAVEYAEDTIEALTTVEEISEAIQECASQIRDVSQEYEDAIEAMPALEDTVREKIDELDQFADDLESLDFEDEPEEPDLTMFTGEDAAEKLTEAREEWEKKRDQAVEEAKEIARDGLANLG